MRYEIDIEGVKVSFNDGKDDISAIQYPDYAARAVNIISEINSGAKEIARILKGEKNDR